MAPVGSLLHFRKMTFSGQYSGCMGYSVHVVMRSTLVENTSLTTMPYSARYPTYLGHNVHVVMRGCLRFYHNVPLITMTCSARYPTYLGHNVHVVYARFVVLRFLPQCAANNDDTFGARSYISRPQCTRCYARLSAVLQECTANNEDLFSAISYISRP